jgi:UV DNA damage endonuclease
MNRIGYCCISLGINVNRSKKNHISVNRGMTKKTFIEKGLKYASELTYLNLCDLLEILKYNVKNKIYVYRLSSDLFPWMSEYQLQDLLNINLIKVKLIEIGNFIKKHDIRTGTHPGPFNVLASENTKVVDKTIYELNQHAELMDLMGLDQTHYYPINIHINTTKPTKEEAAARFVINFDRLSDSCKSRLTIENDDSPNQYSVADLYSMVHIKTGVPIVFDQHHFNYGPQDMLMEEALRLAYTTWYGIKPLTHMSSARTNEDTKSIATAHADYIYEKIQTYGLDFDIEIEAKAKDLAVLKYRKDYELLLCE